MRMARKASSNRAATSKHDTKSAKLEFAYQCQEFPHEYSAQAGVSVETHEKVRMKEVLSIRLIFLARSLCASEAGLGTTAGDTTQKAPVASVQCGEGHLKQIPRKWVSPPFLQGSQCCLKIGEC